MSTKYEEIKVFLSCPEDIVENGIKDVIIEIIKEDNDTYFKNLSGISFDLKHWKGNVYPGKGNPRVQDRINEILRYCDIYLGILWTRFGLPRGSNMEGLSYSSGTEEEFYLAKTLEKTLWFFFCRYPIDPFEIDPKQLNKVQKFREQLKKEQIWYVEFSKEEELRKLLKKSISNFIEKKYKYIIPQKKKYNLQSLLSKADFLKYNRGF